MRYVRGSGSASYCTLFNLLCAAQEDLDPPTTINLISSYDRMDDVLFYCSLIKDYERIVAHHVQHKDLGPALALLTSKEV